MINTVQRAAMLSPEAKRLYQRLTRWWLTKGEWLWSQRDLHQRVKSGQYYRRVAELDAHLAELLAAGLLRRWPAYPLNRIKRGPEYAYVAPQGRGGRGRRPIMPHAAPAPPSAPVGADPLAWRVASMRRQCAAAGRLFLAPARPDQPLTAGLCQSCGEGLSANGERWCSLCLNALIAVRDQAKERSTRPG